MLMFKNFALRNFLMNPNSWQTKISIHLNYFLISYFYYLTANINDCNAIQYAIPAVIFTFENAKLQYVETGTA